ncbi:MAG TPA: crotonase/enoyl-CoA hydratase family protein [Microscillaceae bacterium]|jgi:enoyl-CoA hydratase|nr:crotonase/enoyl-CoA hydratase family protein [Microscillaceae bacterium]
MTTTVLSETHQAITTISLNRPEVRNAVDGPTAQALAEAFAEFEANDKSKIAVWYGLGGHFCAGADLKDIASQNNTGKLASQRISAEGHGPMGPTRMLLSKPVIAAISGYAVAGGMELALWADLRVMEETAIMGIFCRRWGVPLIDGGTIRLPRLIGLSRALDLILTGRPVKADEALAIGLANRVVPEGKALEAAQTLAAEIAHFPQLCLKNDRMSAYLQHDLSMELALQQEFALGLQTIESQETLTGAQRFASGKGRGGSFEQI